MPAIIGALVAALIGALRQYLPGLIGRVLLTFGIALTAHEIALPALKSFIQSYMGGLPSVLLAYAGALAFDKAVTLILSAYAAVRLQRVVLSKIASTP
ncbi:MAG: DUF2523 domain-containing protein [Thermomonas sp.]|uniref:DUF2523 family protein n=1 Tax=Thermomonas sp. TaxID=1971895 RepID=UPI001ECB884E|nr:DUF2523 family protein [Thermomonas sp.]MBV2210282.1 DUF2523 domain-containing protein [Thermomonas sp.]